MGIALSVVGFAEVFSQIGIGPALIQKKELDQQHIAGAFFSSLLLGIAFTVFFALLAPAIGNAYNSQLLSDVIQVVSLSFTLSAVAIVPRALMMRAMDFKSFFICGIISIVGGNLITGLLLAWAGYDIWAYVFALLAQNALLTLSFWLLRPVKIPMKWEWKYTRELIRYGGGSTLFNAFNFLATRIDVLMVPVPTGKSGPARLNDAGVYERSSYLMGLPITILGKLSDNVLFSGMSMLQNDERRLRKTWLTAVYFIGLLVIPGSIFIIFFAKEVVGIYLGSRYISAVPVVQILFAGVILRAFTKVCDSLLRAKDVLYKGSLVKLLFCFIMAVGIYISLPYGLHWVALSVAGATLVQFLLIVGMSLKLLDINWLQFASALRTALLLALPIALISLPIRVGIDTFAIQALPGIAIAILINGGALLACTWWYPAIFGKGENNHLKPLLERFEKNGIIQKILRKMK
jgi:PST family polysaccharide transporter